MTKYLLFWRDINYFFHYFLQIKNSVISKLSLKIKTILEVNRRWCFSLRSTKVLKLGAFGERIPLE